MLILGLSEDLFDAGASLTDGERVLFAANEERYTRRKNEGGFPRRSLEAALRETGATLADVDRVCVSGLMTPPLPVRLFPKLHDWIYAVKRDKRDTLLRRAMDGVTFLTPLSHTAPDAASRGWVRRMLPAVMRRRLPGLRPGVPVEMVDHHEGHAAGAGFLSGYDRALCVTADGMGDGLSLTVSRFDAETGVERLWAVPSRDSFGLFFEALTEAFGFVPCRDEGKLTGLAALGDPARVREPELFRMDGESIVYTGPHGRQGVVWAKDTLLRKYPREDVAAWAQDILEKTVLDVARRWVDRTGLTRLAVAGGVFANVKLNQRLHELDGVETVFVYPNMGDGGLSLGAIAARGGLKPQRVRDVFFGDGYPDARLEQALRGAGLSYERRDDIGGAVAERLAEGALVARFDGRMEWGPRALGNRSILAPACDAKVPDRLNTLLRRSDFMPFAPALPEEDADLYVARGGAARHAAEFMTVCFNCTPLMAERYPSVVHVDGTARSQFVRADANPGFHRILARYRELTGGGVVLNTSFNMHEEPIVRTPEEGADTFVRAGLDWFAMGPFLARRKT